MDQQMDQQLNQRSDRPTKQHTEENFFRLKKIHIWLFVGGDQNIKMVLSLDFFTTF